MTVRQELARLSAAEEFFRYLDVPFERQVLDVARLHILRRMGDTLAKEAPPADATVDDERAFYRGHLQAAYDDFVAKSPLQERVFKVLKDAVKEKPKAGAPPFVPLTSLARK